MGNSNSIPPNTSSVSEQLAAPSATSAMNENPMSAQPSHQNQADNQNNADSSYAIGYQEALSLELKGRHAKFFADAFASEYETAIANKLSGAQAIAYATDFAGPYALAFMAFLKENSDILVPSKLLPEAQNFAITHISSYENKFKEMQHRILDTQAKAEQAAEEKRLADQLAQENLIKKEKKASRTEGYTQGLSDGKKLGAEEHYKRGYSEGHAIGHKDGSFEGFKAADTKDYEEGLQSGKVEAYKRSGLIVTSFGAIGTVGYQLYHYFF